MYDISAWRYQRFHISYLIAWLSFGIILGLVFSKLNLLQVGGLLALAASLTLVGAFRSRRWWSVIVVLVFGLIAGAYRGTTVQHEIAAYNKFAHAQVLLSGYIVDDPTYGKQGDQQFRLDGVKVNSLTMTGQVFVGTHNILDIKRGDYVALKGKLTDGFGSYQATMRYATLVRAEQSHDPILEARDRFATGVRNIVPEPAASLGIGFVVGQRSALPQTLDDQLRVVGLTHIVVASGYNLTILVRFMRRLLARHSKYLAALGSVGLMMIFVAVSGMSPSMNRAAVVTGLSLLAWYFGRRFHPLMLILYVASVTAWWKPVYIWSDIGWYLSFLAFAGVLIVSPLIVKSIYGDSEKAPAVMQLVVETVAAQIMTLPLILFIFGQLPVLSLLSNVLVAPVVPLAMVATTLAGISGMLAPSLLGFVGVGAGLIVGYTVNVVELLAGIPWAQLQIKISSLFMVAMYLSAVGATIALWLKTKHNFRSTSVVD